MLIIQFCCDDYYYHYADLEYKTYYFGNKTKDVLWRTRNVCAAAPVCNPVRPVFSSSDRINQKTGELIKIDKFNGSLC